MFQGADAWFWVWTSVLLTVLGAASTWYYVNTGRDRAPKRQRRGEETIEKFGTIEEDRAPVSKFLLWTYICVALWAVGYAFWTGIQGIGW